MTVAADVVLAATELEHDELLAAVLLDDLAGDLGARDERLADVTLPPSPDDTRRTWSNTTWAPCVAGELLDHDGLAGLDSILLSTRLNHGVHDLAPRKNAFGIADFTDRGPFVKLSSQQSDRSR